MQKRKNVSSNEIIKWGDCRRSLGNTQRHHVKRLKIWTYQTKLGDKCVNILKAGRTQKDANVRKVVPTKQDGSKKILRKK